MTHTPPSQRLPNGDIRVQGFDHAIQAYVVKDWPQHRFERNTAFLEAAPTCRVCGGAEAHHDDLGH